MNKLKKEYKEYFYKVKKIVLEFDLLKILNMGAPNDEYDDEIARIVAGLKKCNDFNDIQKLIYSVFLDSFGQESAGAIDSYKEIAKRIYSDVIIG